MSYPDPLDDMTDAEMDALTGVLEEVQAEGWPDGGGDDDGPWHDQAGDAYALAYEDGEDGLTAGIDEAAAQLASIGGTWTWPTRPTPSERPKMLRTRPEPAARTACATAPRNG
jgi:hypothetical protein